jgi:hypothetical protein
MTGNKEKGDRFRDRVREYFLNKGNTLDPEFKVEIGFGNLRKEHSFDLGNKEMLVECKNYEWTSGGKAPSAKLSNINESMLIFKATNVKYRKLIFMSKTRKNQKRISETLVEYYIRQCRHLIPSDVEIWEFDETNLTADMKFPNDSKGVKLGGIWKGITITDKDIKESRKELLGKLEEDW